MNKRHPRTIYYAEGRGSLNVRVPLRKAKKLIAIINRVRPEGV